MDPGSIPGTSTDTDTPQGVLMGGLPLIDTSFDFGIDSADRDPDRYGPTIAPIPRRTASLRAVSVPRCCRQSKLGLLGPTTTTAHRSTATEIQFLAPPLALPPHSTPRQDPPSTLSLFAHAT